MRHNHALLLSARSAASLVALIAVGGEHQWGALNERPAAEHGSLYRTNWQNCRNYWNCVLRCGVEARLGTRDLNGCAVAGPPELMWKPVIAANAYMCEVRFRADVAYAVTAGLVGV